MTGQTGAMTRSFRRGRSQADIAALRNQGAPAAVPFRQDAGADCERPAPGGIS